MAARLLSDDVSARQSKHLTIPNFQDTGDQFWKKLSPAHLTHSVDHFRRSGLFHAHEYWNNGASSAHRWRRPSFPTLTTAQMIVKGRLHWNYGQHDATQLLWNRTQLLRSTRALSTWTLPVYADQAALNTAYSAKQIDISRPFTEQYGAR